MRVAREVKLFAHAHARASNMRTHCLTLIESFVRGNESLVSAMKFRHLKTSYCRDSEEERRRIERVASVTPSPAALSVGARFAIHPRLAVWLANFTGMPLSTALPDKGSSARASVSTLKFTPAWSRATLSLAPEAS